MYLAMAEDHNGVEEDSREIEELESRFLKHVARSEIYESRVDTIEKTLFESLKIQTNEMKLLREAITGLSKNINRGFNIIYTGARLFRMVIYSFLAVILLLGATIVYIRQVDIDIYRGRVSSTQDQQR